MKKKIIFLSNQLLIKDFKSEIIVHYYIILFLFCLIDTTFSFISYKIVSNSDEFELEGIPPNEEVVLKTMVRTHFYNTIEKN